MWFVHFVVTNLSFHARAGTSVVITNRILNHGGHGEHGGNRGKADRQNENDNAVSTATRIESYLPSEFSVFFVNSVVETIRLILNAAPIRLTQ